MSGVVRGFLLLGSLVVVGCSSGGSDVPQEEKRVPVSVVAIQKRFNRHRLNVLGTVEANRDLKVSFKIGGRIKTLAFEEGELVKAGELLAELDQIELLAQKRKALENRRKARRDLERMRKLYRKEIVPLSVYQDAKSVLVTAGAELKIVEESLDSSALRAPFTGRITEKISEVGEVVAAGSPIAILAEIDPARVVAAVPDTLIQKVKPGQRADVEVDSIPMKVFVGVVTRLETSADPLSRTFSLEVKLENPGEVLRPGLIARVEVVDDSRDACILIPLDAIVEFGPNPTVFVIQNETALRRAVKMGEVMGEEVEILEGLSPDDLIVVAGQEYLDDEQRVVIDRRL
jgi:RND family efflux transporter MFP subunit